MMSVQKWLFWMMAFAFVCAAACDDKANRNRAAPEQSAREWLDKMGYRPMGLACATTDSDGDGYVTCDVNFGDQKEQLLCGAPGAFAVEKGHGCEPERTYPISGCKTPKPWAVVAVPQRAQQ
jgi:hypothetical protein